MTLQPGAAILTPRRMALPSCMGEASELKVRLALRQESAVVAWGRMTFRRSDALKVIIREGDEGRGGWQYGTRAAMMRDWHEIEHVGVKIMGGELWTPRGERNA